MADLEWTYSGVDFAVFNFKIFAINKQLSFQF